MTIRTLPDLEPNRPLTLPPQVERTLANGLTVIVIRRPAVPLVEVRLRVPFAGAAVATSTMLTNTLFSGTETLTTVDIAAELQTVGGALGAGADPDRLLVSGNSLASGLDRLLEIMAEVLTGASYPANEVETERERLIDRIEVARSQPAHLAREALLGRIFSGHPYEIQTPDVAESRAVTTADLRAMHDARLHPQGATLVLVGDIDPTRALDLAERHLGGWGGAGELVTLAPIPGLTSGPLLLVDRPDSVQSSVRIALPAVGREHPDHAALQLANLIFGGYFSSRWVENIREDKGYTYGPHSMIEHSIAGSTLLVAAEVATNVTAPALVETLYELGRIASVAVGEEELEQARQYALGTLQLGMSTQAGLAGLASTYAGYGLRLDYLAGHAERLAAVSRDDLLDVARRYLAPALTVPVVLGDASAIASSLEAILPVTVRPLPS
ncbi:putative Zn-dependent peptidase [Allocatelliglobosispora scoriae]|uniref:Putative Zn-dependent peptidase n=1 Tax=Allocatelliglobosispora scoriae TaxID=643052 RepID=A0A841BVJ1_9ACTN|nr:pitrilysin family protein [Allocatelliglobosispora scoriae]MBB5871695.1 putative Zn-dependent peptidase [Allocatelliglobosispora scoriae]